MFYCMNNRLQWIDVFACNADCQGAFATRRLFVSAVAAGYAQA
jgi:hypothetical protein